MKETFSQAATTENKQPLTTNIQDIEESLDESLIVCIFDKSHEY